MGSPSTPPPDGGPPAASRGRIKGAAFREFLGWYGRRDGEATLASAAATLPAEWRSLLDPERPVLGVLASEWYPASAVHGLLDALMEGMTPDERVRLADEGARAVMDRTLRGLYRLLFEWMASPERYARFGQKLWSAYYDNGVFRIDMPDPFTAECTISAWASHHPFVCELNCGAAAAIYERMGCESVAVRRESCVSKGHQSCRFVSTWKQRK